MENEISILEENSIRSKIHVIRGQQVMIDRDIIGHFSMPINDTSDDMAAWLNILRKGYKAYPLDEVLQQYRVTGKSASSNKFKASRDVWKVYRKNEKLNLLKSLYNFICYAFNAIKKRVF